MLSRIGRLIISRKEWRYSKRSHPLFDVEQCLMWLLFEYEPTALFSLKTSRATSTVGKTLLTPTPYAAKMAFIDVALRHGLAGDPESLVRWLAAARLRI